MPFVAAVLVGLFVAVLNRRSCAPSRRFVHTTASKVALVGLHLVVAAIIVPVLARHADDRT